MKPTKCPAREKKRGKKSEKRGEGKKRKVKVKTAVSLLNPDLEILLSAPENHSTIFKTRFLAKSLGANGLNVVLVIECSRQH